MIATVTFLVRGIVAFLANSTAEVHGEPGKGPSASALKSNKMMQGRILFQAITIVLLNKIYTRTGDDGTTALVTGPRRLKHDLRVDAYGTIDETNSAIGIARLHTAEMPELDAMLMRIQNDLFDLGADLAAPETGEVLSYEPLRVIEAQVDRIEKEIDQLNADLD
eukprot:gene29579-39215_t